MSLTEKLQKISARYALLSEQLMDPQKLNHEEFRKIAKERSNLEEIATLAEKFLQLEKDLLDLAEMHRIETDVDMRALIEQDITALKENVIILQDAIQIALLPKDEADSKNAIIEIRAGTGGDEAALFASVLLRMYQYYSERKGWKFEVISISATELDGIKEVSASISGKDVFANLKFESGVHRVQRVPETEASGRIHTSAATVAVLPEAEEVDIEIKDADLRIDVFRASGAGGQHVNTTDSAVRITHLPTGIVVSQQDEKSQHKNKAKALKILRARIYEAQWLKQQQERSAMRKGQVGSGDRSERIRTYNYPQSRVTDHRINYTSYQLTSIVNQGELDEFIDALKAQERADLLANHQ